MLGKRSVVAFVTTAKPAKAAAFYGRTLGLKLISDDPFATVSDAHGTPLRLSKAKQVSPAPHTILGWEVPKAATAVKGLTARGVKFVRYPGMGQDELGIWDAPGGARVAWFKDPDGNLLSLTEMPRRPRAVGSRRASAAPRS